MLHFTNQELAKTYHVSVRTIRNWIESARFGKLDLTLHTKGERTYVANTSRNIEIMKALSEKGKKFRPMRAYKVVSPRPEFYEYYTSAQIYDMITNLEIHHEIPRQYNYFDGGAESWDEYTDRLVAEDSPNVINATIRLLESNKGYIDGLLKKYDQVNVIDVGVGNASPVKKFLEHLISQNKMGRYIGLDISPTMLDIASRNIKTWFGDKINFERHEIDINYDRFTHLLAEEHIKKDSARTVNLILLLGGTLCNMRSPEGAFRVIHDSMGKDDLLIYSQKLDSATTRQYFDFNVHPEEPTLAPIHGFIVDMMNIDSTMYDLELGYDEERRERFERIRFKLAVTIKFEFDGGECLIDLNKNDAILIWRSKQQTVTEVINQFAANDFYPLHSSQTSDQEYLLAISRIARD